MGKRWRAYRSDIVNAAGDPYMRRWIIQTPLGTMRLHNILSSDDDSALHDHPWSFISLLLVGSYIEVRDRIVHRVRWVNFCKAEDAHRLVLDHGPVWSIVLSGPVKRKWGFHTESGWVYWREYEEKMGVNNKH